MSKLGKVAVLSNAEKPTQRIKENEEKMKYSLTKGEDKTPETYK